MSSVDILIWAPIALNAINMIITPCIAIYFYKKGRIDKKKDDMESNVIRINRDEYEHRRDLKSLSIQRYGEDYRKASAALANIREIAQLAQLNP